MVTGRRYPDGRPLAPPIDERELLERLVGSLEPHAAALTRQARAAGPLTTKRGELERAPTVDLGNPLSAGWTVLVADGDPRAEERIAAVADLARCRGAAQPLRPLVYEDGDWSNWIDANYTSLEERPYYVLILGGPNEVPFLFQALLDTGAAVGRLDFDSGDEYAAYAEKLIRRESKAIQPTATDSAFMFAPDVGPEDATHYSRRMMAEPLIEQIRDEIGFGVEDLLGDAADKGALVDRLASTTAALVYTAGHGMIDLDGPLEQRKRLNGAICCQPGPPGTALADELFTTADVPSDDEPFLEGSVFFQFACFGAGTPARSGFAHWGVDVPAVNATEDFVAALPKRLLGHPRGPVAFVGHVDVALLHGFDDPDAPATSERWHPRLAPFRRAVRCLLERQPVGYAMSDLNDRYGRESATLANAWSRHKQDDLPITAEVEARLTTAFLTRNDAQNYVVLGDPAASLRINTRE